MAHVKLLKIFLVLKELQPLSWRRHTLFVLLMVPGGVLCREDNLSECRGCTCKSILGDHWASWRGQPANIECLTSTSIQLTGATVYYGP